MCWELMTLFSLVAQARCAARALMAADAAARCTPALRARLKDQGFVQLRGAVPLPLVHNARKEINRELGGAHANSGDSGGVDQIKARVSQAHPAITDLVKASKTQ